MTSLFEQLVKEKGSRSLVEETDMHSEPALVEDHEKHFRKRTLGPLNPQSGRNLLEELITQVLSMEMVICHVDGVTQDPDFFTNVLWTILLGTSKEELIRTSHKFLCALEMLSNPSHLSHGLSRLGLESPEHRFCNLKTENMAGDEEDQGREEGGRKQTD
ncbi:hypothetical protein E5288_WYG004224 [Bos mutus]|uniref:Uncharacterized protein n=1 Tax=Bos mutus TaxID=72004 RepID=A0A6B0RCK8_9CETA|nr:hypothetical protein [Bos mutus]